MSSTAPRPKYYWWAVIVPTNHGHARQVLIGSEKSNFNESHAVTMGWNAVNSAQGNPRPESECWAYRTEGFLPKTV